MALFTRPAALRRPNAADVLVAIGAFGLLYGLVRLGADMAAPLPAGPEIHLAARRA